MRIDGLGEWLKVKKNKALWQSRTKKKGFAAHNKRKLTLQWLGKATSKIHQKQYDKLHNHCWVRTGCGLTVDGSTDEEVKPQGMSDYKPPAA